jgi:superfamily I DNA and RNA helicase
MPQKLQSQMSFTPGKMSEGDEFVLRELYEEITNLRAELCMDKDGGPNKRIQELIVQNDAQQDEINALKVAQNVNEEIISKLQASVQSIAAKLDAENVTNLDTDYLLTVNEDIY